MELDAKYTQQGLGSQSIRLYLNEIQRLTGKGEFGYYDSMSDYRSP